MSMTPINYNVVVKELSNGLIALDSDVATRLNFMPHIELSEFRTIRYGAGRQKGVTQHAVSMAAGFCGNTLYLVHNEALRNEVLEKYRQETESGKWLSCGESYLTVHCHYLPENWKMYSKGEGVAGCRRFGLVVVDEAGFFFNKFSFDKIYRSLVEVVTPDVVIHLIN